MKKLYLNITLFLLPVLCLLVFLPVKKRLKFQEIKNDCFDHGLWIYDRIFHSNKPMDIVFLGSSHSINGLDDKLIEKTLSEYQINVVNLGYCRLGRNLSYLLLKEVLEEKCPLYVFIEVNEDEDRYSHPMFPYLARTDDVLLTRLLFNRDIADDVFTHFSYKIDISQREIFHKIINEPIRTEAYGFAASPDTASVDLLETFKRKRQVVQPGTSTIGRKFYMTYPRGYLKKISHLCSEKNIQLCFLFLPSFGVSLEQPKEYQTYLQYGKVFFAPNSILNQPSNWYDENHLNQSGATKLSEWIAKEIEKKLLSDKAFERQE